MKVLVLGASPNPARFSYKAVQALRHHGHEVIAIGLRKGEISGVPIHTNKPVDKEVDTVTLYLNPDRQKELYDYILSLEPKRIIMNPGTHNPELIELAGRQNIEVINDCTLIMLNSGQF